jgi:hypothetical protein
MRRMLERIGPLEEVGIREKLRKHLGRSFNPSKVREEMARDKGHSCGKNNTICLLSQWIWKAH